MSVHDNIARDATKVASLTSVARVRTEDERRAKFATNGGEKRLADRLRHQVARLGRKLG